jgi:hypothetical protein
MRVIKHTIRGLLFVAAVAAMASCAPTVHEVEVVHTVHHNPTPAPSTAPADFGVVNQYDRQSR